MELTYDEIFNPVKGREQELIEVFVEFYGEKWRDKITQRINNTTFLSLNKQPVERIEKYFNLQLTRIEKEYADEVGFVKQNYITNPQQLGYVNQELSVIKLSFEEGNEEHYQANFMPVEDFVKALGIDYGDSIKEFLKDDKNYNLIQNKIAQCINIWNEKYLDQCQSLQQNYNNLVEPLQEDKTRFDSIVNNYKADIKECIGNYMSDKISLDKNSWEFIHCTELLNKIICLGQNKLQDELSVSDHAKKEYIKLFKTLGFDYGDDYDKYINDAELMEIVFNPKLIKKLDQRALQHRVDKMQNNKTFMQTFELVKTLDTRDGNFDIMESVYTYLFNDSCHASAFCQQYIDSNGEIKNICVCPLGVAMCDATLIHELGHAIQCDIIQDMEDSIVVKSGFDTIEYKPVKKDFDIDEFATQEYTDEEEHVNRPYEILNEVWHDYMMRVLTLKMNDKGISFGKSEGFVSGYVHGYRMMSNFIHQNPTLIKDAQMDSSPYVLRDMMGEDNYNKLAKAVEDCVEICQDLRSFKIMREIEKVADINKMTMFDIAHIEHDWSPTTRKYLDTFIMAEEVFNGFNNGQLLKN